VNRGQVRAWGGVSSKITLGNKYYSTRTTNVSFGGEDYRFRGGGVGAFKRKKSHIKIDWGKKCHLFRCRK